MNHNIKIIPSPYPTVTEFEEAFVQDGMNCIAGAMKDVLAYIKEQQQNDIQ